MSNVALFAFNRDAKVQRARIGRGNIEVIRIDDVLHDPDGVAALGFAQSYSEDRSNLYPGFRAAVPEDFSTELRTRLAPILQRTIDRDASFFSVVATASKDLVPLQCIPHYDSTDPNLYAAVIYLCDSRFSGTVFYRHRKTGYEEITATTVNNYQLALNSDMRTHGAPQKEYIAGDSVLFEAIFSNELKFNSAIIYPARMLHAAKIAAGFDGPKNKNDWRLTVTTLLHAT
jgi:hypothetical protein